MRRPRPAPARLARRSLQALAVGFPVGIAAALAFSLLLNAAGEVPDGFSPSDHESARPSRR